MSDVQTVTVTAQLPSKSDDLSIILDDGQQLSGWQETRVTRGIERCPSDFALAVTEKFPLSSDALQISPGQACTIMIGGDLVLTGYVDTVRPALEADAHTVTILGRGKCQDLVDCSAEWPGGQIQGNSVSDIASKLAGPYGIDVTALTDVGGAIPLYQLNIGETGWEIIEKLCRYRQLLAYEDVDGNLLLSAVSKDQAASGFAEGVNVQRAEVAFSAHQRFQTYISYAMSVESLNDLGNVDYQNAKVTDTAVMRHRVRRVVCPVSGPLGTGFAEDRLIWEAARRAGRSYAVSLTTDAWRDAAGVLYTPNTQVRLQLPSLKLPDVTWTISEVTFHKDGRGTTCDLLIMPPQAFIPEPEIDFQIAAELVQQLPAGGPQAGP
jgi:prophage tail gpP-like protein